MTSLIKFNESYQDKMVSMITDLFNFHRNLLRSREEFYQTVEESKATLSNWKQFGEVLLIKHEATIIGFLYIKYGGQSCAWLEDLYIEADYRGQGLGKLSISLLDDKLKSEGILSLFVDVIPRNIRAIELYNECGFDHLNMIQLRKNYDESLNKKEKIDILGYSFNKY